MENSFNLLLTQKEYYHYIIDAIEFKCKLGFYNSALLDYNKINVDSLDNYDKGKYY